MVTAAGLAACTGVVTRPQQHTGSGGDTGGGGDMSGSAGVSGGAGDSGSGSVPGTGSVSGAAGGSGSGSVSGGTSGSGGAPASACTSTPTLGPTPLRRLSRTEYTNTVRDLLRDPTLAPDLTVDPLALGFDNNADVLTVTPTTAQSYLTAAESLAAAATANLPALAPCLGTATSANELACVQQLIRDFGARAFRRPLADAEVTALATLFSGARGDGDTLAQAVAVTMTGMLQSPYFLYRVEVSPAAGGAATASLSPYERASRLSYLLWGSMPDDALFAAAAANQLGTSDQLAAEARRMLADPRARAMVASFDQQWLQTYKLTTIQKDAATFPDFTPAVASAMKTETEMFVDEAVWQSGGSMMDLFTAPYTFRNRALSDFYGPGGGVTGGAFTRVSLDGGRYAGLLTQGGMMAAIAHANQTDPTRRGKFVRVQLLCESIQPPPPGVMTVPTDPNPALTTRQRAEAQRGSGGCGACHQLMDGIGFGFEHFDAVGRWRDTENGIAIDASGAIVGTDVPGAFDGAAALGAKLAASAQVRRCAVTQWFRFAAGRVEQAADACTLEQLDQAFDASGDRVRDLLLAMTTSPAFTQRSVQP